MRFRGRSVNRADTDLCLIDPHNKLRYQCGARGKRQPHSAPGPASTRAGVTNETVTHKGRVRADGRLQIQPAGSTVADKGGSSRTSRPSRALNEESDTCRGLPTTEPSAPEILPKPL